MLAPLTVLLGPARSGKTHTALAEYRQGLQTLPPGACLWLSPTSRSAAEIRARLLADGSPGFLRPNVMTFERFAATILSHEAEDVRPLSPLARQILLREIIDRLAAAGELPVFREIATTSGFAEMLSGFIGEIKRLEIWPEAWHAACQKRGMREKDQEIIRVYQAYQQELLQRGLYDAQGQFWTARTLIQEHKRRPFDRLRLIVADGFTDFTSTQHEILHSLAEPAAGPAPRMIITLPGEAGSAGSTSDRDDLFAKSTAALKRLQSDFGSALQQVTSQRRPNETWRAMAHLEANLFRLTPVVSQVPAARIHVLEAAGEVAEVEELARQIKQLLVHGDRQFVGTPVRPRDIVVAFRTVDDRAVVIRETFSRYGIPFSLSSAPRVADTGVFRAILQLITLAAEDWPYRRLLAVVTSNYFRPPGFTAEEMIVALKLVRALQVPSGRHDVLKSAESYLRWSERKTAQREAAGNPAEKEQARQDEIARQLIDDDEPAWGDLRLGNVETCRRAVAVLKHLDAALRQLPATGTLADWVAGLESLAAQLGIGEVFGKRESPLDELDAEAWELLSQDLPELDRTLAPNSSTFDLAGFRRLLLDLGRMSRLSPGHDEAGRVRVLSARSIRALDAPYVFFAGLTERAFPAPERADALYSEGESRQLREAGLPLSSRSQHYSAELLLFYEVITRATRGLWLSYPAFDERAEPLLPSPFLLDVQRTFGPGTLQPIRAESLSPLPQELAGLERNPRDPQGDETRAYCDDEYRLLAVDAALARRPKHLVSWSATSAQRGQNLLTGLEVIASRAETPRYGNWDGMLETPGALNAIAAEFQQRQAWSATDLEAYARCPYQYFLARVLKVDEVVDLRLEIDHLSRGRLLHDALYKLQHRINEAHGRPTSPLEISAEEYARFVDVCIHEVLEENPPVDALRGAMHEIDRRLMVVWFGEYRQQYEEYDALSKDLSEPMRPAHLEVGFGMSGSGADPLSSPAPFNLEHNGQTLKLRGRIDRIDLGRHEAQPVFNIIDYKSGRSRPHFREREDLDSRRLQLELYALAAQQLLQQKPHIAGPDVLPLFSAFWFLANDGIAKWRFFHELDKRTGELQETPLWIDRRKRLLDMVFNLAEGMRQGQFPMHSAAENCTSYCEFATVCRVNHARSLNKVWSPPVS